MKKMAQMEAYAFYETELGYLKIGYQNGTVFSVGWVQETDAENIPSEISEQAFFELREYLDGKRRQFLFPYQVHGTGFQQKVWRELCRIPYGETRTYQEIAEAIGNPRACRAVGMANHKNPMGIVIPCHRVIGADGKLTGYAGGLEVKRKLLELERRMQDAEKPIDRRTKKGTR